METIFWIAIIIIFYTYAGYGLLLYMASFLLKETSEDKKKYQKIFTPSLTVIVAAYNEVACIADKIQNTLSLNYPAELLSFIFITDGSDDGTAEIVAGYPQIKLLHTSERDGKIAAIHRAMQQVYTELVVFTDANTILNTDALLYISHHYQNKKIGAVAGEKRIDTSNITDATSGEGFYWRYESVLKQNESDLYSVIGAAGELFSIRSALYEPIPFDTILDDFIISMKIITKGYLIKYEPRAFAIEKTSLSISEESKRKVRIAAGGIQSMMRLAFLLVPFPRPVVWFEYISHRVLRWVITPYLLVFAFDINVLLTYRGPGNNLITGLLIIQSFFYVVAFAGYLFEKKSIRFRPFFIPYYFCLMNYCMIKGLFRYVFAGQAVSWEKTRRR